MEYFYNYFVRDYQERHGDRLLPAPAALFRGMERESVQLCRRVLRNGFSMYREGRNAEVLKKLLGEYRDYISGCQGEHVRDRYNAFVYRYMVPAHVGMRAIGAKLGVTRETVYIYINRALDEMLMLCMGIPAMPKYPEEKEAAVQMLIGGSRLLGNMAGDYVLGLFPGRHERETVEKGRQITAAVMERLAGAAGAYSDYCNDGNARIDTDIRKAGVLGKCLAGVPCCQIAADYGCSEGTIYADMRENEKRLAAMMFETEGGQSHEGPGKEGIWRNRR